VSDQELPLVSVITPSYNQGHFIRETIQSVLTQDYPNLEHIVVDGGSTDGTLPILREFAQSDPRFRFVSEPDRGQSHAINKGLALAQGEIIGWLNSDDTYQPGAIRKAVDAFRRQPGCAVVHGKCLMIDEKSKAISALHVTPVNFRKLFEGCFVCQPAAFIRKSVFQQMGGVDESLNFCMDYDLWIRISKQHSFCYLDEFLANARRHPGSKSVAQWSSVGIPEVLKTVEKHYGKLSKTWAAFAPYYRKNRNRPVSSPAHPASLLQAAAQRVKSMNRNADRSVPPSFTITVESADSPLQVLVIKGRPFLPGSPFRCDVLVNGQPVGRYAASGLAFTWEIPLDGSQRRHEVTILSSRFVHQNHRMISFFADEVLPLTAYEAQLRRRNRGM